MPSSGTQYTLVINPETVFGTPITANSGWLGLHIPGTVSDFDLSNLVSDATKRADGTLIMQNTDNFKGVGGFVNIPLPPTVATDITLDYLLYLLMQNVTEGVGTPYVKTYNWNDAFTSPVFSSNSGKFVTAVLNSPIAGDDRMATSCVLSTLNIAGDAETNGGRLTVAGNLMSGFTSSTKLLLQATQDIGTPTTPGTDYYNFCSMVTKTSGGTNLIVDSFAYNLESSIVKVGCDANGDAQNYNISLPKVTGTIKVLVDANTQAFISSSRTTGFDTSVVMAWGSGADPVTTDGDLLLKANVGFDDALRDFPPEVGTLVDLTLTGFGDGTNGIFQAGLANAVDRTW